MAAQALRYWVNYSMKKRKQTDFLVVSEWLPYRFWASAIKVGNQLESFYKREFGLTREEWRALAEIANGAPLAVSEVAQKTNRHPVVTTRTVASLVDAGLVDRAPDLIDRRKIVLSLSSKGIDAYSSISNEAFKIESKFFDILTEKDKKNLSDILRKLEAC